MVQIATSDIQTATAYSNQRKIDRTSNGVLWSMFWDGTSTTTTSMDFCYSTDDGATWTKGSEFGFAGTGTSYTPNASLFIDLDDYAHVAYKDRHDGYIYYRRGTPNAGRTAWTWSAATLIDNAVTHFDYPDIVAHREDTGWRAHLVWASTQGTSTTVKCYYNMVTVTSGGAISVGSRVSVAAALTSANSNSGYPSIDFNHTGDGKTVAGSTPHLYVAWSAGTTGAGNGIRFKKATYSGGTWTWGTEREIDSTRFVNNVYDWLNCLFDGTRVIIGGMVSDGTNRDVILHDQDAADTTTTARVLLDNVATVDFLYYGALTYDSAGNVYLFGRDGAGASGTRTMNYRKWTRSGASLGPVVTIDSTGNDAPYISAKRGYSNNLIEFIYTDGTASPYTLTFDSISLNSTPNVPTDLQVTSDVTDTTPAFSASISDPDASQQVKGRFQIYQSDGVTLVGTVDSAFRTGAGSVTAEYASALPVGTYKVQAATVDDAGAISAYSAQVTFYVKTSVSTDDQYIWDVGALVSKDLSVQWDVLQANTKDLSLTWNVFIKAEDTDLTLEWGVYTPWTSVVPDEANNPVTWEKVSP